jgi:Leucine-rich repeat (LRR) protein
MFLNTEKEIKDWLDLMKIKNYTIFDLNGQLVVDVKNDVNLITKGLTKIPVKFNKVQGFFDCRNNKLESLEGCPEKVDGFFGCVENQLTSLKGCPKEVGNSFYCSNNKLQSLEGGPKIVSEYFWCANNLLTSLKFAPEKIGVQFWCSNNKIVEINNILWVEYFKKNLNYITNNQLLDTNFLDIKYKELFETMSYDLRTIKENQKLFKQFLDAGLITIKQVNLDLWR